MKDEQLSLIVAPSGKQYYAENGTIKTLNNEPFEASDLEFIKRLSYENAILKDQARKQRMKFTAKEDDMAGNFYARYMTRLEKWENKVRNFQDNGDYVAALQTLDEMQAFCNKQGRGGQVHWIQMYERLHNSKNPCFSYRSTIVIEMNKVAAGKTLPRNVKKALKEEELKIFEQMSPTIETEILALLDVAPVKQTEMAKKFEEHKKVYNKVLKNLITSNRIEKKKQGNFIFLQSLLTQNS